jgi:hypothetical protein
MNAYLHQIVYSYWANRWRSRWDTTDAAVESVHFGEFPLHNNIDSFCTSEIVIIDKPTGHQCYVHHRKTSKDSTDTFIEQVQFTDSSRKACRKRIVYLSVYMHSNEHSDRLLDRPLSDKTLPHVTYSQPIQRKGQPISFVRQQTWSEEWHIRVGS